MTRAARKPSKRARSVAGPRVALHLGVSRLSLPLPEAKLRRDALRALKLAKFRGTMSLAVVDDTSMRKLNRDFHATDATTDVLAFPLADGAFRRSAPGFDAEVVVSLDTARREAKARGIAPAAELMLYVVHGTLHLMGHDDHDPRAAARMHRATLSILDRLGYANTIDGAGGMDEAGESARSR